MAKRRCRKDFGRAARRRWPGRSCWHGAAERRALHAVLPPDKERLRRSLVDIGRCGREPSVSLITVVQVVVGIELTVGLHPDADVLGLLASGVRASPRPRARTAESVKREARRYCPCESEEHVPRLLELTARDAHSLPHTPWRPRAAVVRPRHHPHPSRPCYQTQRR